MSLTRTRAAASWLMLLAAAACSQKTPERFRDEPRARDAPRESRAFAAPGGLLPSPAEGNIRLRWENHATATGGSFIEFRTDPRDAFTLIDAVWSDANTFVHEDVARDTSFQYRVRPFFGAPSPAAELTTGAAVDGGVQEEEGPLGDALPTSGATASLRDPGSMAEAAPAELSAVLASPTSAIVRWKDRARDEDGYLLEMAPAGSSAFQICVLLPANATSFRKVTLPPTTKVRFRARAYFLGTPSNEVTASLLP